MKSQTPKETSTGNCNELEYPARRDLTEMVSHGRPDATEILFDQMKITAYVRLLSPPHRTHTQSCHGVQNTPAEVISVDQLPNSSKASTCTIPEKRVSTIKGGARAFF